MKNKEFYQSLDGKKFKTKEQCLKYENTLNRLKKRYEYLSVIITNEILNRKHELLNRENFNNQDLNNISVIVDKNIFKMGYLSNNEFIEFNKNFPFKLKEFEHFCDSIFIKYGYEIKIPEKYYLDSSLKKFAEEYLN